MRRSRAALVVGLLVVLAAFAYGTETRAEGTLDGRRLDCGPAISASWLVSGTPDTYIATGTDAGAAAEVCGPLVESARAGVLGMMGAGALLAALGWTSLSRGRAPRRAGRPEVRSA